MLTFPKPRGVIFDLDGTLLDTLDDLADSANEALASVGLPTHPVEAFKEFIGDGVHVLVQRILPAERRDDEMVARVLLLYRAAYGRRWKVKTRPYPGIEALLETLAARGIPQAVLSNKPQAFTELCIYEILKGYDLDPVLGQREAVPRKPHPAGALEIATAWGLLPAEVVFVGDTTVDIQTATAAGMLAVGVAWGFRPEAELLAAGAHFIADSPAAITALFS